MNFEFEPLSSFAWAGVVVLAIGALVLGSIRLGRIKWLLTPMRIIIIGIVIFLLLKPTLLKFRKPAGKPLLGVLVDTSASMGIHDPVRRMDLVADLLKSKEFDGLSKSYGLRTFTFAQDIQPLELQKLLAQGDSTDIGQALSDITQELDIELAGIVLVTDGSHNGGADPMEAARKLIVPVYSIGVGDSKRRPDIAVKGLKASSIAFAKTPFKVDLTVSAAGFKGKVPVFSRKARK